MDERKAARLTHPLLDGGVVNLRNNGRCWMILCCVYPNGKQEDGLRALACRDLEVVGFRSEEPAILRKEED